MRLTSPHQPDFTSHPLTPPARTERSLGNPQRTERGLPNHQHVPPQTRETLGNPPRGPPEPPAPFCPRAKGGHRAREGGGEQAGRALCVCVLRPISLAPPSMPRGGPSVGRAGRSKGLHPTARACVCVCVCVTGERKATRSVGVAKPLPTRLTSRLASCRGWVGGSRSCRCPPPTYFFFFVCRSPLEGGSPATRLFSSFLRNCPFFSPPGWSPPPPGSATASAGRLGLCLPLPGTPPAGRRAPSPRRMPTAAAVR